MVAPINYRPLSVPLSLGKCRVLGLDVDKDDPILDFGRGPTRLSHIIRAEFESGDAGQLTDDDIAQVRKSVEELKTPRP